MSKTLVLLTAAIGLFLSACAPTVLPNGQKPAWNSHMLPAPPEDGYMSASLLERELHPDSQVAQALQRHEAICAETGCPEWTSFIEDLKRKTAGKSSKHIAWRTHLSMKNYIHRRAVQQYGEEYHASPAEFFAAKRTGDGKAHVLAEFQALKELGWNTEDLRYTVMMAGRYYTPSIMLRADDWHDGGEHMLYPGYGYNEFPGFYRHAALIYSTNGSKLWEQEWARNQAYQIPGSSPSMVRATGDRTSTSLFY